MVFVILMYFFLVGLEFMRLCCDGYGAVPLYFYINKSFYLYLKKKKKKKVNVDNEELLHNVHKGTPKEYNALCYAQFLQELSTCPLMNYILFSKQKRRRTKI